MIFRFYVFLVFSHNLFLNDKKLHHRIIVIYMKVLFLDPKKANILFRSFSVYSNTQRLLTFNSNPNALDCLDGIRTISMMWVVVGHTFQMHSLVSNISSLIEVSTTSNINVLKINLRRFSF